MLTAKRAEKAELTRFGECVMELARKRKIRSQAALKRALMGAGYDVAPRTLATYLQGRSVVDPILPHALLAALKLNKSERRALAEAFTFGQPPRHRSSQASRSSRRVAS